MGSKSEIEWTDSTWNPVTGCTKISAGCDNCYAETMAERFRGSGNYFDKGFDLVMRRDKLDLPLRWKRPRKIFVNSMSDLFHKEIPGSYLDEIFDVMEKADWHIFQVLTKRSSLMRDYINNRFRDRPCPVHIWLGVSVENRQSQSRILHLHDTNCEMRFISAEPLLESLGKLPLWLDGEAEDGSTTTWIDWVIVGGESGHNARPMQADWAREIRDQCLALGVSFMFKQWGGKTSKAGGRELDNRFYDGYPDAR